MMTKADLLAAIAVAPDNSVVKFGARRAEDGSELLFDIERVEFWPRPDPTIIAMRLDWTLPQTPAPGQVDQTLRNVQLPVAAADRSDLTWR